MNNNDFADSPVYSYLRNPSMIDYRGQIAAVFFIGGCNFRCGFCHNATLIGKKKKGISWDRLVKACDSFKTNWIDATVISGGEPTLDARLPELIRFFKDMDWKVKLDTNGSRPDVLQACLPMLDCCAMDIKTSLAGYPALTGFDEPDRIRKSIEILQNWDGSREFRTTAIPGIHSEDTMHSIGKTIKGAPVYILQSFIPRPDLPDSEFRAKNRTSPEQLEKCRLIAAQYVSEVVVG